MQKQLPVLHRQPSSSTSSYQFCTSCYQPITGDLPAEAITSSAPAAAGPAPATAFLHQLSPSCTSRHQQLSVLNQRPLSCTSRYQQLPVLDQRLPSCTSPKPATIFLHQWKPVLHKRPSIQRILVLYHLSRPAPATRSCSNDHHPASAIVRRTLFRLRFAIIKFGLSKQHPCFVILA